MQAPPPLLETPRLVLTALYLRDAPDLWFYASDPEVTRYLSFPTHQSIEDAEGFLTRLESDRKAGRGESFAIRQRRDDRVLGSIGMDLDEHGATLGYCLARDYWGQGIASEALARVLDWLLGPGGLFRASAYHHVDNAASGRVMQKAGMVLEGRLKRYALFPNLGSEPAECLLYAKTR